MLNKSFTQKSLLNVLITQLSVASFALSSSVYGQQDLVAGTDLTDSQLSLSLTTTITTPSDGEGQSIVISQYGVYNKATLSQKADSANQLFISQDGFNNSAILTQLGDGNTIEVIQYGDDNWAEVVQVGDANIANIKQDGEQGFTVHQIGNDMVVNVTQY